MSLFLELIWACFVHVDDNGKDILILGEGPTHGSDDATLTV